MIVIEAWQLKQRQSLPLEAKIIHAQQKIREWYEHWDGQVYVSFSGGKDSTVLLHLVRSLYPRVPALFINTGLEYPELRKSVETYDNIKTITPEMNFAEVINVYGYPLVSKEVAHCIHYAKQGSEWAINNFNGLDRHGKYSKFKQYYKKWSYLADINDLKISHMCCVIMKERPAREYERLSKNKPFIGMLAEESRRRRNAYLATGCNAFKSKLKSSNPLSIWLNQDILHYIKYKNLLIPSVYGDIVYADLMPDGTYQQSLFGGNLITTGVDRTGCMFCMFGVHLEKGENRFQKMKRTHPKQHNYCIYGMGCGKAMDYINVKYL